jgi:N12 class adenine-specific DNA methylase
MATAREKLTANVDAIETVLRLGKDNPTPEQRQILQQYAGFGDLKCILLDPARPQEFSESEKSLIPLIQRLHDVIHKNLPDPQYDLYFQSLKESVLTSFYTPGEIIHSLDNAFKGNRLFFKNVLDPSAGLGAFTAIRGDNYTLIEKDLLTRQILSSLNSDKKVISGGFEDIPARFNNHFNAVISNIPFGNFRVFDPVYLNSKNPDLLYSTNAIHTYFFEKGLDTLRNGGVLAFITSAGVMDSRRHEHFRRHLLSRARLIATVRLPENTFDGTKVQSDLIILQKDNRRTVNTLLSPTERRFIESQEVGPDMFVNGIYADDRSHCIATDSRVATDMYGHPDIRFTHAGGVTGIARDLERILMTDIRQQIDRKLFAAYNHSVEAAKNKPLQLSLFDEFNNFSRQEEKQPKTFEYSNNAYHAEGSFQLNENETGLAIDETTAEVCDVANEEQRQLIRDYVHLRDAYFELKNFENEYLRENPELRAELNRAYATFVSTPYSRSVLLHPLSLGDVSNIFHNEPSFIELKGLEYTRDGKITKADIFFEPVAFGRTKESYTAQEALYISRNRLNRVDVDYIQSLTGLSEADIIGQLKGQIFKNPVTFQYETADIFLSGNVVEKYERQAKVCLENAADYELKEALDALREVIPEKIAFHEIGINLGERWIPMVYYDSFAQVIFNTREAHVHYTPAIDDFDVDSSANYYAHKKYGVQTSNRYYSADDVLRFALIDNMPAMTKTIGYGKEKQTVPDTKGIQRMNATIELIKNDWRVWLDRLPAENKRELEDIYNRRFNCFVKPQFDGSFQTFPGLDLSGAGFKDLYPSQKDAVLRLKSMNGGIIDHTVGGGKTMIMCCAAYEMGRLGLANKPLIVGMKANAIDIAKTFRRIYPDAKVLYAEEKEYGRQQREEFFNKIQNNNWDCIIMTHEQFMKIPQSRDIQIEVITEELTKIDSSLYALDNGNINFKRARKALEQRKKTLTARLKALGEKLDNVRDSAVNFKTMGIDHLICDESHKFKNSRVQTRHERVAGIGNTQGSDRSMNMKFAIREIQKKKDADLCATFVSGTTIVNSCTELYVLFDYLRPQALEKQGISCFDAWASVYTRKSKELEFGVTGELQLKERFREFVKIPELSMFYSEIADVKTAEQIGIERPEKNERLITLEQTSEQHDMFERLKKFAETGDGTVIFRDELGANEKTAKMLIATNTAKKASIDMRLIDENRYDNDASNRTQAVADNAFEYYKKYDANKGAQFIFCDIGVYKSADKFSIYGDIRQKLVEKGVPENEIMFIQDFKTDKQRLNLFERMNAGSVRFLLGSTETLGTGVNAQERCVAIHHVDIPWTPKDFEQRNGRGVRQGNKVAKYFADNKVDVLIYATKESLDTYKFNLVANKAHFIQQIKDGSVNVRTLDEGGMDMNSGMSYGEYIAVLSGNTDLLEKAKLERMIALYKTEERVYYENAHVRDMQIRDKNQEISKNDVCLQYFREDLQAFKAFPRDEKGTPIAKMTIEDRICPDIKVFGEEINRVLDRENRDTKHYQPVGAFGDFELVMIASEKKLIQEQSTYENLLFVQGNLKYSFNRGNVPRTVELAGKYPLRALERIEKNLIPQFESKNAELKRQIETLKKVEYTFPNKDKLEAAQVRLAEIKNKLESSFGDGNEAKFSFDRNAVKCGMATV